MTIKKERNSKTVVSLDDSPSHLYGTEPRPLGDQQVRKGNGGAHDTCAPNRVPAREKKNGEQHKEITSVCVHLPP